MLHQWLKLAAALADKNSQKRAFPRVRSDVHVNADNTIGTNSSYRHRLEGHAVVGAHGIDFETLRFYDESNNTISGKVLVEQTG